LISSPISNENSEINKHTKAIIVKVTFIILQSNKIYLFLLTSASVYAFILCANAKKKVKITRIVEQMAKNS
jgi:hypothetical protein